MIVVLAIDCAGYMASGALAVGLERLGETVVVAGPDDVGATADTVGDAGPAGLSCAMASGDDVASLLARAEEQAGPLRAVILVPDGELSSRGDLAGLDEEQWMQRVEIPLQRTLASFQGSYRRLRERGGCLILLVPTLSLVGAAGFAPWAAVAEGQRALAKAAARAWGADGITVNCVAVPAALLRPADDGDAPDRPGQPPRSLAHLPDLETEVAAIVISLVAEPWAAVTGTTVAVDGGIWMTP